MKNRGLFFSILLSKGKMFLDGVCKARAEVLELSNLGLLTHNPLHAINRRKADISDTLRATFLFLLLFSNFKHQKKKMPRPLLLLHRCRSPQLEQPWVEWERLHGSITPTPAATDSGNSILGSPPIHASAPSKSTSSPLKLMDWSGLQTLKGVLEGVSKSSRGGLYANVMLADEFQGERSHQCRYLMAAQHHH